MSLDAELQVHTRYHILNKSEVIVLSFNQYRKTSLDTEMREQLRHNILKSEKGHLNKRNL